MKLRMTILLNVVVLLASCQSSTPQLAILDYQGKALQERQILQLALGRMLGVNEVIVSDNAFRASSDIIVERSQRRGVAVKMPLGRDFSLPDHFRLWLQEGSCLLEHIESGQTMNLGQLSCKVNAQIERPG